MHLVFTSNASADASTRREKKIWISACVSMIFLISCVCACVGLFSQGNEVYCACLCAYVASENQALDLNTNDS